MLSFATMYRPLLPSSALRDGVRYGGFEMAVHVDPDSGEGVAPL